MAWRTFRVAFVHAAKDAGVAAITAPNAFDADFPKDYLIDNRAGNLTKFAGSASDHEIHVDLGAAFVTGLTRLFIPAGHNLDGVTLQVREDDNAGFTSPTLIGALLVSGTGLIEMTLTATTERYLQLDFGGTGTWELPELWYSELRTFSADVHIFRPSFRDRKRPNLRVTRFPSGVSGANQLGPEQRDLVYQLAKMSGTAETIMSEMLDYVGHGPHRPFWVYPVDDAEPPVLMDLLDYERDQDSRNPQGTGSKYQTELTLLEHL